MTGSAPQADTSNPMDDTAMAFRFIDARMEVIESRIDAVEKACTEPCAEIADLRGDLGACSTVKDNKIQRLSDEVRIMKDSLDKLDTDMDRLTKAVADIGTSLHIIAANTGDIKEVVEVYKNAKGGMWLMTGLGKLVIGFAAILTAWYVITHTSLTVPK